MEVILGHGDFQRSRRQIASLNSNINSLLVPRMASKINTRSIPPNVVSFRIIRQPLPKYVMVLESSSSMNRYGLWIWISKAAQKFIRYDLPATSRMAIVTFSNVSVVRHAGLGELGNERNGIADTIPDKYKVQRSSNRRCVYCGIKAAMEEVLLGNGDLAAGAHIILVTRGTNDSLTYDQERTILKYAENNKVRFSSILLPERNSAKQFYDKLSKVSGGRSIVVPTTGSTFKNAVESDTFFHIIEAFKNLRRLDTKMPFDIPVTVHSKVTTRAAESLDTRGNFTIDSTRDHSDDFCIVRSQSDLQLGVIP